MQEFDLIVIGAGSGLDVAAGAVDAGLKVAIIEDGPLGGTCLNRGCIPSKIIIKSAEVADIIRRASEFGLKSSLQKIDLKKVTTRASSLVDTDAQAIEQGVKATKNQTLFKGKGRFVAPYTVEVNGEQITAKKIVIAAGARPTIPSIPGLDKVPFLTSTEALRLTKLPESMIIIGGGYIAAELGYFYAALGTKVTILQRNKLLIPREDIDVTTAFTKLWEEKGDAFFNTEIINVVQKGKVCKVTFKSNNQTRKISAEKILIATGVTPNSNTLDIEKSGVQITDHGFIKVNKYMETSMKNIWALGDIAGIYMFKHSANQEAEYVLEAILKQKKTVLPAKAIDYYPMPHAIFTNPQIAGVGLTEQEAQQQERTYVIGKYEYKMTGMGAALAEENGFVKFIVDQKTKEILGCHILGPEASTLIHEVCVAMKADRRKALEIIRNTIHIHPALSEVVQRAAWKVPV